MSLEALGALGGRHQRWSKTGATPLQRGLITLRVIPLARTLRWQRGGRSPLKDRPCFPPPLSSWFLADACEAGTGEVAAGHKRDSLMGSLRPVCVYTSSRLMEACGFTECFVVDSVLWLMSVTVPKGRGQGLMCLEDSRAPGLHRHWVLGGTGLPGAGHPASSAPSPKDQSPPYSRDHENAPPSSFQMCVWGTLTLVEKYSWSLSGSMVVETPPQSATRTYCLEITHLRNSGTQPEAEPGLMSVAVGCSGSSTEDSRAQATVFLLDSSISAPNTHMYTLSHSHLYCHSHILPHSRTYVQTHAYTLTHRCTFIHLCHTHTLMYRHTS